MRWYADNSELMGYRDATIPDIVLFGGVAVPDKEIAPMTRAIEDAKAKYWAARAPIKWNMRDLRKHYERHDLAKQHGVLLSNSEALRTDIFAATEAFDYSIIVACIESYQTTREGIKQVRPNLASYVFSNGLMRFSMHAKASGAKAPLIVLDWPDGGDATPFTTEYASAFNLGHTAGRAVPYLSGPLRHLGFCDSVLFTTMLNSTLLQFADLIVGASREAVECAIGRRNPGLGVQLMKRVKHKLYGAPNKVFGRGINVASGNAQLSARVEAFIKNELQ